MSCNHADYIIYAILTGTCTFLAFFCGLVKYNDPASQDNFTIINSHIEYLYDLVIRQDHVMEIIYFSFLLALFLLGYFTGRLQRRVSQLEEDLSQAAKHMGLPGLPRMAKTGYPVYGVGDDIAINLEDLIRRVQRLETSKIIANQRIATLEQNIVNLAALEYNVNYLLDLYEQPYEEAYEEQVLPAYVEEVQMEN